MKLDIKSMLPDELEKYFLSIGEKKYRALQVFSWLHRGVKSFGEMTDLSHELRNRLSCDFYMTVPEVMEKHISRDGTIKYLFGLSAATDSVESVLLNYKHGTTICISSQLGCKMGCVFCASGIGGFVRNLTPAEMLDQVLFSAIDSGRQISNIVLMGIGEPLDNFDNVMRFIQLVSHQKGTNIGSRHLTLSTCGVIENIDRLSVCGVKLSLAISLHAPDNETRSALVPYNRNTGIKALFDAAARYTNRTGRRVTYEYTMIDGINDSPEQAMLLSRLLRGTGSHLNLILLNPVPDCGLAASTQQHFDEFTRVLMQNGIAFTTRRSLGADIKASCGQLRRKSLNLDGIMGSNAQRKSQKY